MGGQTGMAKLRAPEDVWRRVRLAPGTQARTHLADALKVNEVLTTLNLYFNGFVGAAAEILPSDAL